jgi:hypothetical protein
MKCCFLCVNDKKTMKNAGFCVSAQGMVYWKRKISQPGGKRRNGNMKTKFGIVGCGFLGNIVADAWEKGLLEDYEPVAVWVRKGGDGRMR